MHPGRITLSRFLSQALDGTDEPSSLAALLVDLASTVKVIASMTAQGALAGAVDSQSGENLQGEVQRKLEALSRDAFVNTFTSGSVVAGLVSEAMDEPVILPAPQGKNFLAVFDPLDGASNIDVNGLVGSIFSVLRAREDSTPGPEDFLQAGRTQLAAGYAVYGPFTMMVISVGKGTHGFTLDREADDFILSHPNICVPQDTSEFAINTSNERFWEPPVKRYVAECKAGKTDVRGRDFKMRSIASTVAGVHRILMRGGLMMHPEDAKDSKDPLEAGLLRLMYQANPMAMVVEQAGGLASSGRQRILEIVPEAVEQRVSVILGSRNEVERIERYYREHDEGIDEQYSSPLFKERSLFQ